MVYYNSRLLAKTNSCFLSYHILFNLLQLTSPQGDEQYGLSPITVWCHFNSRLRKETNISHRLIHCVSYISIHVSARRRTLHSHCYLRLLRFQFTSPQGDERCIRTVISVCYDFNSRLRKETNGFLLSGVLCQRISTRISARRRTILSGRPFRSLRISIHVSARRRTKIITQIKQIYLISTHVSARRRT